MVQRYGEASTKLSNKIKFKKFNEKILQAYNTKMAKKISMISLISIECQQLENS